MLYGVVGSGHTVVKASLIQEVEEPVRRTSRIGRLVSVGKGEKKREIYGLPQHRRSTLPPV